MIGGARILLPHRTPCFFGCFDRRRNFRASRERICCASSLRTRRHAGAATMQAKPATVASMVHLDRWPFPGSGTAGNTLDPSPALRFPKPGGVRIRSTAVRLGKARTGRSTLLRNTAPEAGGAAITVRNSRTQICRGSADVPAIFPASISRLRASLFL